jgi:hypothetical protein
MPADNERTCYFICQRGAGDSPASEMPRIILEALIVPAMQQYKDFRIIRSDFEHEPGSITGPLTSDILSADLVIVDLSDLSPSGYYQIGSRHSAGLPLVMIAQTEFVIAISPHDFSFIRYEFLTDGPDADTVPEENVEALANAIKYALNERAGLPRVNAKPLSPKEQRIQLADRLEQTADALRLLRINSVADESEKIDAIAAELREAPDEDTPNAIRSAALNVLKILEALGEQLATAKGARLVIAGIVSLIVGGTGAPAVTAYALSLDFFKVPKRSPK